MEQSRTKLGAALAVFLTLLSYHSAHSAVRGQDVFQSVDFVRESLMSFLTANGITVKRPSKFLQALKEVERSAAATRANPGRLTYSPQKIQKWVELINKANNRKSSKYALELLGRALYVVNQHQISSGGRTKRSIVSDFLSLISDTENLMATNGAATLVFAIDDTGSMGDDIAGAKQIATDIVNHPRNIPVDYILSPFNDPDPISRAIYMDDTQGIPFTAAIQSLAAHGGGDCPELAFHGMINALLQAPLPGSPMFVFTDASPKDATALNIQDLELAATMDDITINFFLTGQCGLPGVHPAFDTIATATNGQVFRVSVPELYQLSGLTLSALSSSSTSGSGSGGSGISGRKKRSASGSTRHSILVEDSIEKLTISVTAANPGVITLQDPSGATLTSGRVSLSKAAVYQIDNPQAGTWTLVVPHSAGKYDYRVKSSSSTNIAFQHYFLYTPRRSRQTDIPIAQPLSGEPTKLLLTVVGVDKIQAGSPSLELITQHGNTISSVGLTPKGSSGGHFLATFVPPAQPFKLKLKGNTKKGNAFERISRDTIEAKTAVLTTHSATNDFTLGVGRPIDESVIFKIYNAGRTEFFDITASDQLGYVAPLSRKAVRVFQKRSSSVLVHLRATNPADVGKTDVLTVTAKGRTSGVVLSQLLHLLVV